MRFVCEMSFFSCCLMSAISYLWERLRRIFGRIKFDVQRELLTGIPFASNKNWVVMQTTANRYKQCVLGLA